MYSPSKSQMIIKPNSQISVLFLTYKSSSKENGMHLGTYSTIGLTVRVWFLPSPQNRNSTLLLTSSWQLTLVHLPFSSSLTSLQVCLKTLSWGTFFIIHPFPLAIFYANILHSHNGCVHTKSITYCTNLYSYADDTQLYLLNMLAFPLSPSDLLSVIT